MVRLEHQRRPQSDGSLPAAARVHAQPPQPRQHLDQSEVSRRSRDQLSTNHSSPRSSQLVSTSGEAGVSNSSSGTTGHIVY